MSVLSATRAEQTLKKLRDPKKAAFFPRFFKTGPGEYGEGDKFLGITVPQVRSVVKTFRDLPLPQIVLLLESPWHEVRLLGVLILVDQSRKGDAKTRQKLSKFYLAHLKGVNNWDLVDASAPELVGRVIVEGGDASILKKLAQSKNLWTERVAVVATFSLIRAKRFKEIQELAQYFFSHPHDLMHKAVGWMLREMGKKDEKVLRAFLDRHTAAMPRTALRYAIERFPEGVRKQYLAKPYEKVPNLRAKKK